jgi:hypothetical protein
VVDGAGEGGRRLLGLSRRQGGQAAGLGPNGLGLDLAGRRCRRRVRPRVPGQDLSLLQCRAGQGGRTRRAGGCGRGQGALQLGRRLLRPAGAQQAPADEEGAHRLVQHPAAVAGGRRSTAGRAGHPPPGAAVQVDPGVDEVDLQHLVVGSAREQRPAGRGQLAAGPRGVPLAEVGAGAGGQAQPGDPRRADGPAEPDHPVGEPAGVGGGPDQGRGHRLDQEGVRLDVPVAGLDQAARLPIPVVELLAADDGQHVRQVLGGDRPAQRSPARSNSS